MIQLTKGTNAPLETDRLTVSVEVSANADLSALLLAAGGKVRSESDFVFYNAPNGPGVTCKPPAGGQGWQVAVELGAVPADVEIVRLVTSLDEGGRTFGQVGQPVARVSDAGGTPLVEFAMTGLSTETIVIALEFYRRQGAWKVRAVGQGYAGGLAALLADHGVDATDEPAATTPPPAAPAPVPPPASSTPPPPTYQATPATPPSTPTPPPPPPSSSGSTPPPPPSASTAQTRPAPTPPPPAPAASGGSAGGGGGAVSLTKGRPVNLTKGQTVSLVKDGNQKLTLVRMGLGWDPIKKGGFFGNREVDIDLDASAILFAGGQVADVAFYNNLTTKDGSIQHMGDNRTGEGEGDDEVVAVDLTRVPVHVDTVVFVVTSYQGQTFEQIQNAFCRLIDHQDGELARYTLAGGMPHTAMVMAKISRDGSGTWQFTAIGDGITAKTPIEALPQLTRYLGK